MKIHRDASYYLDRSRQRLSKAGAWPVSHGCSRGTVLDPDKAQRPPGCVVDGPPESRPDGEQPRHQAADQVLARARGDDGVVRAADAGAVVRAQHHAHLRCTCSRSNLVYKFTNEVGALACMKQVVCRLRTASCTSVQQHT